MGEVTTATTPKITTTFRSINEFALPSLKLPPPPCAVLLVYWKKDHSDDDNGDDHDDDTVEEEDKGTNDDANYPTDHYSPNVDNSGGCDADNSFMLSVGCEIQPDCFIRSLPTLQLTHIQAHYLVDGATVVRQCEAHDCNNGIPITHFPFLHDICKALRMDSQEPA